MSATQASALAQIEQRLMAAVAAREADSRASECMERADS